MTRLTGLLLLVGLVALGGGGWLWHAGKSARAEAALLGADELAASRAAFTIARGSRGDRGALLLQVANDRRRSGLVRGSALSALASCATTSVGPSLVGLANDPDAQVRAAAIRVLQTMSANDPALTAALIAAALEPRHRERMALIAVLGSRGDLARIAGSLSDLTGDPVAAAHLRVAVRDRSTTELESSLLGLLRSEHPAVRALAAEILADARSAAARADIMQIAATDPEPIRVRQHAIRALAEYADGPTISLLREMAETETEPQIRVWARAALETAEPASPSTPSAGF